MRERGHVFERTAHLDCSGPSGSPSSGPGSSSAVDCTSARVEAGSQYVLFGRVRARFKTLSTHL